MNKYSLLRVCLLVIAGFSFLYAKAFYTEVPFVNSNGKLIAKVVINGIPGNFIIDTGAPCCITNSYAEKLNLIKGVAIKTQDSNGNTTNTSLTELKSVKIGNITFNNLQALSLEKDNIVERFGIDGIIGYNLFQMGIVRINQIDKVFTFTNEKDMLSCNPKYSINMIKDQHLALIPIDLGVGLKDTIMYDSGAAGFYEMSSKTYLKLESYFKDNIEHLGSGSGILSAGASGLEQTSLKHKLRIKNLNIGNVAFSNVETITTDAYYSRLGSSISNYGDVIIDYLENLFYFIPNDEDKCYNLFSKDWEVLITVNDGKLCAGLVWNKALPIKTGDRIVEINKKKYDNVDLVEVTTKGIPMQGDEAEIGYVDSVSGNIKYIKIHKQ